MSQERRASTTLGMTSLHKHELTVVCNGVYHQDRTRHDVVWLVVYAFGRPEART